MNSANNQWRDNNSSMSTDHDSLDLESDVLLSPSSDDQQKSTWSPKQIRCLEEYKGYYANLITHYSKQLEYVEMVLKHGQDFADSAEHSKLVKPKKPSTSLSECLKPQQKRLQNKLAELHKYLISRKTTAVEDGQIISGVQSQSLDDYKMPVRESFTFLERSKAAILRKKFAFAALLDAAFKAYTCEKALGKRKESWECWLKATTGCKDVSYFRKLRLINTMLASYKQFQYLSISFDELYRRKKDIHLMLQNKAYGDKWKWL